MKAAADLLMGARSLEAKPERGGLLGKVLAIVQEHPGLATREIRMLVQEPSFRVSGSLSTLKLEGSIVQDRSGKRIRWTLPDVAALEHTTTKREGPETWCVNDCGTSILFGSLATEADRARPTCARFPFALRGAE